MQGMLAQAKCKPTAKKDHEWGRGSGKDKNVGLFGQYRLIESKCVFVFRDRKGFQKPFYHHNSNV